jgi:hypothetical protein
MAEKKKAEMETIKIENFFTRDNEEKGVWFEAIVNGQPTGIEGLVLGANSSTAIIATNQWNKEIEEQKLIEDDVERNVQYEMSCAKRVAAIVSKLRGKGGKELSFKGKTTLDKSDIELIMLNSPAMAASFLNFSNRNANFLEGKKNS